MNTIADIDRLLVTLQNDMQAEIAAVNARYAADISALRRTKELLGGSDGATPTGLNPVVVAPSLDAPRKPFPGIRSGIHAFVDGCTGEFILDQVLAHLDGYSGKPTLKRAAISSELWRMDRQGTIVTVKKGRPNIYRKVTKDAQLVSEKATS